MKQWLMLQNFTALNTMYRKTLGEQKQRMTTMGRIRAQTDKKDGIKGASTFDERYQELKKITQEAAAAKSNLK